MENAYGVKIYKDFLGRYETKIEDHAFDFDLAPWVNVQEDGYMGRDVVMGR